MSPFNTFHSCGSSSRLVLRRNLPERVINSSDCSKSAVERFGAPFFIVRNFLILNSSSPLPTLFCLNTTGRPSSQIIIRQIISISGDRKMIASRLSKTSRKRFIKQNTPFIYCRYGTASTAAPENIVADKHRTHGCAFESAELHGGCKEIIVAGGNLAQVKSLEHADP